MQKLVSAVLLQTSPKSGMPLLNRFERLPQVTRRSRSSTPLPYSVAVRSDVISAGGLRKAKAAVTFRRRGVGANKAAIAARSSAQNPYDDCVTAAQSGIAGIGRTRPTPPWEQIVFFGDAWKVDPLLEQTVGIGRLHEPDNSGTNDLGR